GHAELGKQDDVAVGNLPEHLEDRAGVRLGVGHGRPRRGTGDADEPESLIHGGANPGPLGQGKDGQYQPRRAGIAALTSALSTGRPAIGFMAIPIAMPSLGAPLICSATGANASAICSAVRVGGSQSWSKAISAGLNVVCPDFASLSTPRIFFSA